MGLELKCHEEGWCTLTSIGRRVSQYRIVLSGLLLIVFSNFRIAIG
jgi:hypothetical protein